MKKEYEFVGSFILVMMLSITSVFAFPFGGFVANDMRQEQESLRVAVENNDYSSWKTSMENIVEKMKSMISRDEFDREVSFESNRSRVGRRQMMAFENLTYDDWKEKMEEQLSEEHFEMVASHSEDSLGRRMGVPFAGGFFMNFSEEELIDLQKAIEDRDYTGWKSLLESQITEDNYASFVEMHANRDVGAYKQMRKMSARKF